MPIFYLDTSAVVKRYRSERGTEVIARLFDDPESEDRFYSSFLSILEFTSGILCLVKGDQLRERVANEVLARFRRDIREIFRGWPLDNDIVTEAVAVVERHKLRSGDAIHLATAISLFSIATGPQVVMVTSDRELLRAAEVSGITTLDPQATGSSRRLDRIRSSVS